MERPEFDRLLTAALPGIEVRARAYAARYNLRHEWRDIAQTALLNLLRFADHFDPAKGELMPWACVAIINTIKNRVAQIAAQPYTDELDDAAIKRATYNGGNPESDLQVSFILENLNEEALLYVEGYTYQEIAIKRGFNSKNTCYKRIERCSERLSKILGIKKGKGRRMRNCPENSNMNTTAFDIKAMRGNLTG